MIHSGFWYRGSVLKIIDCRSRIGLFVVAIRPFVTRGQVERPSPCQMSLWFSVSPAFQVQKGSLVFFFFLEDIDVAHTLSRQRVKCCVYVKKRGTEVGSPRGRGAARHTRDYPCPALNNCQRSRHRCLQSSMIVCDQLNYTNVLLCFPFIVCLSIFKLLQDKMNPRKTHLQQNELKPVIFLSLFTRYL